MEQFGSVEARLVDGKPEVVKADDVVQVSGEVAQQLGVNPPLDGRITFAEGYDYDLCCWDGTGVGPGRYAGTYIGRRVR